MKLIKGIYVFFKYGKYALHLGFSTNNFNYLCKYPLFPTVQI